jgi:hypothetical protein
VDYYMEHRITWWWKLAEMRHPMDKVDPVSVSDSIKKQMSLTR